MQEASGSLYNSDEKIEEKQQQICWYCLRYRHYPLDFILGLYYSLLVLIYQKYLKHWLLVLHFLMNSQHLVRFFFSAEDNKCVKVALEFEGKLGNARHLFMHRWPQSMICDNITLGTWIFHYYYFHTEKVVPSGCDNNEISGSHGW